MQRKIGIIGNGFVGNSIAFGFSPTHEIRVHDKDPKRNFKREHTFMFGLWKSQDKKCGISKEKINARDVMNPLVTEVDHIHPHSKGGGTTQLNAALVYKSENRSKSAKIQNIPKVNPLKDVA